ncbi:MAG: glycosyltransferase, partial [Actinomycetia bacterium]|nr:glycosyltransferase [Actinomycetes bacterium]
MSTTVAIPALNEEATICACLESLCHQTLIPDRVIVADGGSHDRTIERVHRFARDASIRIDVIDNPQRRVSTGLNSALAISDTDFFFRLSAHATLSARYLEILTGHLEEGWTGAGGRKVAVGTTPQGRANAAALGSRVGIGGSRYHYSTRVCEVDHVPSGGYKTSVAKSLGGWAEDLPVNQDYEFDQRLRSHGGRIILDPSAMSYWQCRQTLTGHFAQFRRYGAGKAKVVLRRP